jgi:transposase
MGRQRKRYSESFKHRVIVEALTSGKTMAEVATANNIAPSLVTEWKEAFINGEESKELKKVHKQLEEKDKTIETLMKKIGEKELEVELLKKKTARFDKKTSGNL